MTAEALRLQRYLADLGLGSRRAIETWISSGRVQVNGRAATLGQRVTGAELIRIDGKAIRAKIDAPTRVLMYHKPSGVICSRRDPAGHESCYAHLPSLHHGRWIGVGRLDLTTTGILLFTNDGTLAHRLAHPTQCIDREYLVRIRGEVDDEMLQRLREGILLDDGPARFSDLTEHRRGSDSAHRWFFVTLFEGRNREVRRLWESQGVQVSRLKRVRFGPLTLPSRLKQARWEELAREDVLALGSLVNWRPSRLPTLQRGRKPTDSVLSPYPTLVDRQRIVAEARGTLV